MPSQQFSETQIDSNNNECESHSEAEPSVSQDLEVSGEDDEESVVDNEVQDTVQGHDNPSTSKPDDLYIGRLFRKPTRPVLFTPQARLPEGHARGTTDEESDTVEIPHTVEIHEQLVELNDQSTQTDPIFYTESVKIITTWIEEGGKKVKKIEKKRMM